MCNNIMVCKFLIQDLKVSLCIANLVHMTAVMVSPALKAQKQELSLQDRVTYNKGSYRYSTDLSEGSGAGYGNCRTDSIPEVQWAHPMEHG